MGTWTATRRRSGRYKRSLALRVWPRGFKNEFALQNGPIRRIKGSGKIKKEFFFAKTKLRSSLLSITSEKTNLKQS